MSETSERWRKPKPGDNMSSLAERVRCADELDARDAEICRDIKSVLDSLRAILKKLGGQP